MWSATANDDPNFENPPTDRYIYKEDSETFETVDIPTYEWIPKGFKTPPAGMVLLIHGLTLHGKRYDVVGKAFASGNYYAVAMDMRGFGKCHFDENNKYSTEAENRKKVDYRKSIKEIARIAAILKNKYPKIPLIAVGESLGCTPCIELAASHPELVDGLILSAPAVRVRPMMVFHPKALFAGLRGLIIDPHFNVKLNYFMQERVSSEPRIVDEMINDPMMRTKMTISELLKTDSYVAKTKKFAKKIAKQTPVLILQGSLDGCVVPGHVLGLTKNIRSDDQTLRWMDHYSHLLLETAYLKTGTVDAITTWLEQHEEPHLKEMKIIEKELKELGAQDL